MESTRTISFFYDRIALGAPRRRRLAIYVYGKPTHDSHTEKESELEKNETPEVWKKNDGSYFHLKEMIEIKDIVAFRQTSALVPRHRPIVNNVLLG